MTNLKKFLNGDTYLMLELKDNTVYHQTFYVRDRVKGWRKKRQGRNESYEIDGQIRSQGTPVVREIVEFYNFCTTKETVQKKDSK